MSGVEGGGVQAAKDGDGQTETERQRNRDRYTKTGGDRQTEMILTSRPAPSFLSYRERGADRQTDRNDPNVPSRRFCHSETGGQTDRQK